MRGNTITLHLQKGTVTRTGSLYQYDYGQRLILSGVTLPEAYEVHFSNSDLATSKTMIGDATGVDIPDEYLLTGAPVYVWVYLHTGEDDGETEFHGIISVLRRAQPTDQEPTPVQQDVITQTIAALNTAVDEAEAAASSIKEATATAETLAPGNSATATLTESDGVFSFEFGIPQGAKGDQGIQGERGPQGIQGVQGVQGVPGRDGKDGKDGKDGADGQPGADGKDGKDGADGYTPVKGTDYWTDSDKAEIVADASAAVENDIIDDSAGAGDTGKVWSADKSASVASGKYELPSGGIPSTDLSSVVQSSLGLADSAYQKPSGGIPATDLASGVIPDVNSKAPVIIDSASGAIASFPDGADNLPVESLVVGIEPVQSGSGDPSPENVRPISGASGVTVYRTGKNLLNINRTEGTPNPTDISNATSPRVMDTEHYFVGIRSDNYYYKNYVPTATVSNGVVTVETSNNNDYGIGFPVSVKAGQKYTLSYTAENKMVSFGFYDAEWHWLSQININTEQVPKTVTVPDGASYMVVVFRSNVGTAYTYSNIQLELGETATAYEPYIGNSYQVTFPSETGTVYGGTLNMATGLLTVEWVALSIATLPRDHWVKSSSYPGGFYINVSAVNPAFKIFTPFMCSHGKSASVLSEYIYGTAFCDSSLNFRFMESSAEMQDWYDYMDEQVATGTPIIACYPLATPITYQLTPTEIKTLLGLNNIWADAGDVEVAYRADTKLFCQKNDTVDDVRVNGTSVVQNGIANVPKATSSTLGVVTGNNYGVKINSDGQLYVSSAVISSEVKPGASNYLPIVPSNQHAATFYGLAKAAGADMASSSNAVGVYPDAQKIAIQKMLGIYEAPWELIREDTFTNAEEANHIITVDGNGQAFELTDIYLELWLPAQETEASVGSSGRIDYYYSNTGYVCTYHGAKTQTAGSVYPNGTFALLRRDNGGFLKTNGTYNTMGTDRVNLAVQGRVDENRSCLIIGEFTFIKIEIRAITGTGHYKLYGKRKWN